MAITRAQFRGFGRGGLGGVRGPSAPGVVLRWAIPDVQGWRAPTRNEPGAGRLDGMVGRPARRPARGHWARVEAAQADTLKAAAPAMGL